MAEKISDFDGISLANHPSPLERGWGRGLTAVIILLLFSITLQAQAQTLYHKAYGDPADPAILFLHGGPGYDAFDFEVTTAVPLAARGLRVIVYDRRGEGRSMDVPAAYTFAQSVSDIDSLLRVYEVESVTLLGHSFGGILATLYAEQYPERIRSVVLAGAPLSYQSTLRSIVGHLEERLTLREDTMSLKFLAATETMDTASIYYSSGLLTAALQNGLYRPESPTAAATDLYALVTAERQQRGAPYSGNAVANFGFFNQEHFTTLDLTDRMEQLVNKTPVYGIYGMEDGLFSVAELTRIEALLGADHFQRIGAASHNVYLDQQPTFLTLIEQWAKE